MRKYLLPQSFATSILLECYSYNKSLQSLGTLGGLISVGAFFCTKTFYLINSSTVSAWVLQYPSEMKLLLILSLVYTATLISSILLTSFLERLATKGIKWISQLFRGIATILLFPFELSIYGVKSIILITFTFRPDYRDLFSSGATPEALYYIIIVLVYLDFTITVVICYMKCSILRPLIPNGGFFSKIDGNFEYLFILLIPLKHLCFYLTNSNDIVSTHGVIKAQSVVPLFYFLEIFLMILISSIYLKELPYYNPMSERILAHFLITTSAIFILLGAFNNSLDTSLKVYLLMIPVQLVSFEYFLRYSYRLDFKATIQAQQYLSLKKILVKKKSSGLEEETEGEEHLSTELRYDEIFQQGTYSDYIKNKKSLTSQEFNLWKDIQKFNKSNSDDSGNELDDKEVEKLQKEASRHKSISVNDGLSKIGGQQTPLKIPAPTSNATIKIKNEDMGKSVDGDNMSGQASSQGRSSKHTGSRGIKGKHTKKDEESIRTVNYRVEALVVNSYVENNSKSPFAHLIRIYWMLTSKVAVFGLYRDLKELLELSTNFRSQSIYFYALKEVENYMKTWYENPAAVDIEGADLGEKSDMSEHSRTKMKSSSSLNNSNLNLAYALYHFHTMKYLKELIGSFSAMNRQLIEVVRSKSCFKQIHTKLSGLIKNDREIKTAFEGYHRDAKPTEKDHILPYVLHLSINTNLVRTGKLLLTEYLKRNLIFKKIQEERNPTLTSDAILIDTIVMLIESDQASLGTILEVYGQTEQVFKVEAKSLVGKNPNYLLPEAIAKFHPELMRNYMEQPLRYFFGDSRESIIKIPGSNLVLATQMSLKIVPTIESAFRIVVGLKPNLKKYNHRIVLNRKMEIDCFSENFLTTLKSDYLQPKVSLKSLSSSLYEFIIEKSEQADKFRGELSKHVRQKKVAKRFKQIIRNGLVGVNQSKDFHIITADSKLMFDAPSKTENTSPTKTMNSEYSADDRNDDQYEVFKIGFPSKVNKNKVFKSFEIGVDLREFSQINQRIIYLDMMLLDENDFKLQMLKNQQNLSRNIKESGTSAISKSGELSQIPAHSQSQQTGNQTEVYHHNHKIEKMSIDSMTNVNFGAKDIGIQRGLTTKSLMASDKDKMKLKVLEVPSNRNDLHKLLLAPNPSDLQSSNVVSHKDSLESVKEEIFDYEDEEFDEFFIASEPELNFNQNAALVKPHRNGILLAPEQDNQKPLQILSDPENAKSESAFNPFAVGNQIYTSKPADGAHARLLKALDNERVYKETKYKFFGLKDNRPLAADVDSVKDSYRSDQVSVKLEPKRKREKTEEPRQAAILQRANTNFGRNIFKGVFSILKRSELLRSNRKNTRSFEGEKIEFKDSKALGDFTTSAKELNTVKGEGVQKSVTIDEHIFTPLAKAKAKANQGELLNSRKPVKLMSESSAAKGITSETSLSNQKGSKRVKNINPQHKKNKNRISMGLLPALGAPSGSSLPDANAADALMADYDQLVKEGNLVGMLIEQFAGFHNAPGEIPLADSEAHEHFFVDEIESESSGARKEVENQKLEKESLFSNSRIREKKSVLSYEDAIARPVLIPPVPYITAVSIIATAFNLLTTVLILNAIKADTDVSTDVNDFQEALYQTNYLGYRYYEMAVLYRAVERGILTNKFLSGVLTIDGSTANSYLSKLNAQNFTLYLQSMTSYLKKSIEDRYEFLQNHQGVPISYFQQLLDKRLPLTSAATILPTQEHLISTTLWSALSLVLKSNLPQLTSPILPSLFLENYLTAVSPSLNIHLSSLKHDSSPAAKQILILIIIEAAITLLACVTTAFLFSRILLKFQSIFETVSDISISEFEGRIQALTVIGFQMEAPKLKSSFITRIIYDNLNGENWTETSRVSRYRKKLDQQEDPRFNQIGPSEFTKTTQIEDKIKVFGSPQDDVINLVTGKTSYAKKMKNDRNDSVARYHASNTRKKTSYFFETGFVILLMVLFFIAQFIYCGAVFGIFLQISSSRDLVNNQKVDLRFLSIELMNYRNSFLYLSYISNNTNLETSFLSKYRSLETGNSSVLSTKIRSISEQAINLQSQATTTNTNQLIDNYSKLLFTSLCNTQISNSDVGSPPESVCQQLDSNLPSRGLIQALTRAKNLLDSSFNWFSTDKTQPAPLIAGALVSFEILTAPAISICLSLLSQLSTAVAENQSSILTALSWGITSAVILLGVTLVILGVHTILKQATSIAFVFRLVPITGVMSRQRVRNQVALLFGLDRRDFGEGRV